MVARDIFFRTKKDKATFLGGFFGFAVGITSIALSYDRIVHGLAELYVDNLTNANTLLVDAHNKAHPDDLWKYQDYSIEDTMSDAEFMAGFIFLTVPIAAAFCFAMLGRELVQDESNQAATLPPPQSSALPISVSPNPQ